MPAVTQILSNIDARVPNVTSATQKVAWMNQAQDKVWRFMASTELYEFNSVADQGVYTLPVAIAADMIKSVQVSASTKIDGTESYMTYEYCGSDDVLAGSQYYNALGNIGIYPTPAKSGYNIKIYYETKPVTLSTNTLGVTPSLNPEYQDIYEYFVCKQLVQSGNAPDIELANNYESEVKEITKKVQMNYYKRKAKNPKAKVSYKDKWWKG